MTVLESLRMAVDRAASDGRPFALVSVKELARLVATVGDDHHGKDDAHDVIETLMRTLEQAEARHDSDRRTIAALERQYREAITVVPQKERSR